jgi:hypothetical protein
MDLSAEEAALRFATTAMGVNPKKSRSVATHDFDSIPAFRALEDEEETEILFVYEDGDDSAVRFDKWVEDINNGKNKQGLLASRYTAHARGAMATNAAIQDKM